MKNKWLWLFLIFLFLLSFFYRIYGLSTHHPPFWVDEFASANQGKIFLKYGLAVFTNPRVFFEHYNITTHILIGLSYKLFGISEFSARLSSVLIGSLVPVVIFLLTRKIFNTTVAISSSLLTTFSYFEIVWSRQARSYIILQFLVLLTFYFYYKLINSQKRNRLNFFILLLLIFLGILTHPLYYLVLISLGFHFIYTNPKSSLAWFKSLWFDLIGLAFLIIIFKTGFIRGLINAANPKTLLTNNLWYYHSFLWREYGLITFLGGLGFLIALRTNRKFSLPIIIYLLSHLFFISFIFKPYVSRYLLPIFPFLFIGMAYTLYHLSQYVVFRHDRIKILLSILLTLFIIANGHKFVNKPKKYYSLNHDFREIANIDYHQIYNIIKSRGELKKGNAVVIDTWWDRVRWYLGDDFENIVAFRWLNDEDYVNGLSKKTPFVTKADGERFLAGTDLRLVLELSDLKRYLKKYKKGFLFVDDSSLPKDVITYAQNYLKKEQYLDHYPLDDNPYSIWPAILYSWGID